MTSNDNRSTNVVGDEEPGSKGRLAEIIRSPDPERSGILTPGVGNTRRRSRLYLALVLAVTTLLCFGMVERARFGSAYDDGIYVTAAKSLATGQGYRIISLPEPVAQTLIPPFYPFVLSLIWRVSPEFPENLVWMMLLSVIAMVGFLALIWRYLVQQNYATRWQALAVVTLTGVNWRTMTLSTNIISEALFALLSVAALYLAEKYEKERHGWSTGALLGLVAGVTFLTRTSGLVLLIAVAFYLVLRRQWRKALLPVAVAGLFVVAWFGWCYLNRNLGGGEHAAYYAGYMRGIETTLGQLQTLNHSSRLMVHLKIIETNVLGLILVWLPLQSLGLRSSMPTTVLVPIILFFLALFCAGLLRELRKGIRLLHVYLAFYLALHLAVPSHSYERYLFPIVPFLLLFLVSEVSAILSTVRDAIKSSRKTFQRWASAVVGIAVVGAACVVVYSNWTGIYRSLTSARYSESLAEDTPVFDWIKANTDPSDVLVCFGDLKYYLYTGRKVVRSIPVNILDLVVYQEREPDADELATVFVNIVDENRGRYVVITEGDFENQAPAYGDSVKAYMNSHPEQFRGVFQSPQGSTRIYRIENTGGPRRNDATP